MSKINGFSSVVSLLGVGLLSFAIQTRSYAQKEAIYVRPSSVYDKLPNAKKGGSFYGRIARNPKSMNSIMESEDSSLEVQKTLYASLMFEDAESLSHLPYLADGYTISADKKTYTFTLNHEAKWQDGTLVTADDVQFTFEALMNPKVDAASQRAYFEGISLQVVDPYTVKFVVTEPRSETLRMLCAFAPVQKKQFVSEPDFNKAKGLFEPVGSGPYSLKNFSRDQSVTLERNKQWWGSKLPHFKEVYNADTIVFRVISDTGSAYERFLKGDLDVTTFTTEQFMTKVRGADKAKIGASPKEGKSIWAKEIENRAPRGFTYLGWNLKKPMFADIRIRQALAHLVDYQQILEKAFFNLAYQPTSPFGSLSFNSDSDLRKSDRMLSYNPKKATELLASAGWRDSDKDGFLDKMIEGKRSPFKFVLRYNSSNPTRAKVAQILKDNFRAGGIDLEIRAMEWNAFIEDVDNRNFEAVLLAWSGVIYPNAKQLWHSKSEKDKGSNAVGYQVAKVDELIEKSNLEVDPQKRADILQQINRIIYKDQPYLFLAEPRSLLAGFSSKVRSSVWALNYDIAPPWHLYSFVK